MNREEKAQAVAEIAAQIEGAEAIFAIDYRGISVPQAAELRSKLREADASFRVVKNRLTKLAAEKAGRDGLTDLLEGPTALTFIQGDLAMAAKAISSFNREFKLLEYKGGLMDGEVLDAEQFTAIARLPGRDALNAQFAGVVASPITGLVRGLGSMVSGLAIQLQAIADQGLVQGEAPAAEEAPAEEAPAAEEEAPAAEEPPAEEERPVEEEGGTPPGETPPEEPPTEPSSDDAPETGEGDADLGEEPAEEETGVGESETSETSDESADQEESE
jgi:large subunit ribosomal protein L10